MSRQMDCQGSCGEKATVTADITEAKVGERGLEYPMQYAVPYCGPCLGELTMVLVDTGTLLTIRIAARLT